MALKIKNPRIQTSLHWGSWATAGLMLPFTLLVIGPVILGYLSIPITVLLCMLGINLLAAVWGGVVTFALSFVQWPIEQPH